MRRHTGKEFFLPSLFLGFVHIALYNYLAEKLRVRTFTNISTGFSSASRKSYLNSYSFMMAIYHRYSHVKTKKEELFLSDF